jgi:molybdenum cofactor biosynthesis enzyme
MNARDSVNVIVLRHTLAMTTADVIALTSVATSVIAAAEYASAMNARKAANVIVLRHTLAMTTVDAIALTIVVTTVIVTTMNIAVRTIHATMILLLKGCDI